MGKKNKINSRKKKEPKIVFNSRAQFHIVCGSDEGYDHEYTIETYESDLGTHYTMKYSDGSCWPYELQGTDIFHLLNTGNGYEWIDTDPMGSKMEYDEFFMYNAFMRLIQQIEGKYQSEIIQVIKYDSFSY